MASISKRGKKWQVKWRDPDGRQRGRSCPDRTTAQDFRREVERAAASGRRWEPEGARSRPDLPEVLKDYLRAKTVSRAPGTIRNYASNLDIFLSWLTRRQGPRARLEPGLLCRDLITDFYLGLAEDGRHGRSRNLDTRRRIVLDVQLAWEWAWDHEDFGEHFSRPRRIEMPRQPGQQAVAPTWQEMDRCIAACSGWHRHVAVLMRFTGLRVQQVMGLRWDDLDLELAELNFRGELGKSLHEQRGRLFPISHHLVRELAGWGRREDWVIVSERKRGGPKERMFRARDMGRAWQRAGVRDRVWHGRPDHAFCKGFTTRMPRALVRSGNVS